MKRQDYINTFKTYIAMRGEEVWFNDSHYPETKYSTKLAESISRTLLLLGFKTYYMGMLDDKTHRYMYFRDFSSKKLYLSNNNEGNVSWYIEGSNKPHNNTTMICYLMKVIFPKLKQ